jgi:hypothetical protein
VQEAAKQCVASRLRTHHGGPAQTLAALERAVQAAAVRLQGQQRQQEPSFGDGEGSIRPEQGGPPIGSSSTNSSTSSLEQRQAALLLLLFVHALEQNIAAAAAGTSGRTPPTQQAVTFFAANETVRTAAALRSCGYLFDSTLQCTIHFNMRLFVPPAFPPTGVPGLVHPAAPCPAARLSCSSAARAHSLPRLRTPGRPAQAAHAAAVGERRRRRQQR